MWNFAELYVVAVYCTVCTVALGLCFHFSTHTTSPRLKKQLPSHVPLQHNPNDLFLMAYVASYAYLQLSQCYIVPSIRMTMLRHFSLLMQIYVNFLNKR